MSEARRIRVLLADDHTLVRAGLRALLEKLPDVDVVAEAGTGQQAIEAARVLKPLVAVVDISMPDGNGLEVTARLRADLPATKVLILSVHKAEEYVLEALRVGAAGYLLKEAAAAELGVAIAAVVRGETYLSPGVSGHVVRSAVTGGSAGGGGGGGSGRERRDSSGSAAAGPSLTPRQREILRMIAEGKSTKEIAFDLGLSAKTVETHRAQIMERLRMRDVASLVRYAIRIGLVRDDPLS
jgi:DNA-binding NarL/FixJ family response regulator